VTYVFPTVEYARIRPTASPANQATTLTTMSASLLAPQENTLPQILIDAIPVIQSASRAHHSQPARAALSKDQTSHI
jgi:hypothetical protein